MFNNFLLLEFDWLVLKLQFYDELELFNHFCLQEFD